MNRVKEKKKERKKTPQQMEMLNSVISSTMAFRFTKMILYLKELQKC